MIIPFVNRTHRLQLNVFICGIYDSAGFTDHVYIIAALGQFATLCQDNHTSHLRLMSGAEERRISDPSPFNIHTIHQIILFDYGIYTHLT